MNRPWPGLAAAVAVSGLILAACGGRGGSGNTPTAAATKAPATAAPTTVPATAAATPAAGGGQQGSSATITAKDVKFDTDQLNLAAGSVTITFQNQDTGVPHNFAIYRDQGYADKVGATNITVGPDTQQLTVTLDPGTYYFRCDVHPTQMTGKVTVQ